MTEREVDNGSTTVARVCHDCGGVYDDYDLRCECSPEDDDDHYEHSTYDANDGTEGGG